MCNKLIDIVISHLCTLLIFLHLEHLANHISFQDMTHNHLLDHRILIAEHGTIIMTLAYTHCCLSPTLFLLLSSFKCQQLEEIKYKTHLSILYCSIKQLIQGNPQIFRIFLKDIFILESFNFLNKMALFET